MPAFLLMLRIGKVTVPLPWFLVWIFLLPFIPITIISSPFFRKKEYGGILRNAHLVWWMTVALHGLKVDVNSKNSDSVNLSFL